MHLCNNNSIYYYYYYYKILEYNKNDNIIELSKSRSVSAASLAAASLLLHLLLLLLLLPRLSQCSAEERVMWPCITSDATEAVTARVGGAPSPPFPPRLPPVKM